MRLARTREWREALGLTQRELAVEADVGEATVARIELGASVTPPTARKVANALNVTVVDLLEHPPEPAAAPKARAPRESGQPSITDLVMDAVRRSYEKDWQAIHRAQESEKLQISIPEAENAAIEHLAKRDKGELIDGLFELAKSKLEQEQENARLRESLEEVTQLREADR